MFYNVYKTQRDYRVAGFLVDEDEMPTAYETEEEAEAAVIEHILADYIVTIEIE